MERREVLGRPGARPRVEATERTQDVPLGADQGDARIGHHPQLGDGPAVPQQGMRAGIRDQERLARGYDVLAQGIRQRGLPPRGPGLGQAEAACEDLAVRLDQAHQDNGHPEGAGGEPGEAVECLLTGGVWQGSTPQCGQTRGIGEPLGMVRGHGRLGAPARVSRGTS